MLYDWRLRKKKRNTNPPQEQAEKLITIEIIKQELTDLDDLIVREIQIIKNKKIYIIGIDGMINADIIDQNILKTLIVIKEKIVKTENKSKSSVFDLIDEGNITHIELEKKNNLSDIIKKVLMGFVAIIDSDIYNAAYICDVKGFSKREITEPINENIIKGSKEAFNETLRDNTAIVRRRLVTKELKIKDIEVGTEIATKLSIIYLDNQVDKEILQNLIDRINKIKIDGILTPATFEEQIIDNKYAIFPQIIYTERVDKFSANIAEGGIGIIIDGLSIGYTVPAVMNMFFQVPEDYSYNYIIASLLRFTRYLCAFLTLVISGLYVAITTFHPEMIPTELAVSIIKSKEGVPITPFLEVLLMLFAFEILIEAGARLPKTIGQTISIVGGLIVGEAAVNAKFTSPAVVVVVAIAGITGFIIPNQDFANALRIMRVVLVVVAGVLGMYGLTMGIILIIYTLANMESMGIPYLVPFTSNNAKNLLKDTIFRNVITTKSDSKRE